MKKLILSMIFATMFIACADNNVCVAPDYTQPEQDTTAVQDTTFETVQDTTDTNFVYDTTDTTTYKVLIGSVCTDMNFQSTGTWTSESEVSSFVGTWRSRCVFTATEPVSYTENYYKLDQIVTILMDNLSFDSNLVNSLLTQLSNSDSGDIVYIYNTNSGLNFLCIRRLVEY